MTPAALFLSSAKLTGHRPATCLPDDCFCELISAAAIRQPVNTWSSLCFVLVGAWILAARGNALPTALRVAYGATVIAVGLSSAAFHGTLEFLPQWLDNASMYAYAALVGAVNTGTQRGHSPKRQLLLALAVFSVTSAVAWYLPALRRYLFDAVLLWALVSAAIAARGVWRDGPLRPLGLAVAALGLAAAAWVTDATGVLCDPRSLLQGHAAWHVLCALATASMFEYYRRAFSQAAASKPAST